jgi:hypothetical protein
MTTHSERPDETPTPRGFRINTEITLTTIIHVVLAMVAAIAFIYDIQSKNDKNTDRMMSVESAIGQMKADLIEKITSIQADNNRRFDDLSRQVSGLPDQATTIRLLDSRMSRIEGALPGLDQRIGEMHDTVLEDHNDLGEIKAANKPKLGGHT